MEKDRQTPVLPLRDVVVFPHMAIPLFVGRDKSIKALSAAMQDDKRILLVAQRVADVDDPRGKDIYEIGTLASILQLLKLPDNTVKVLVEGVQRARLIKVGEGGPYLAGEIEPVIGDEANSDSRELDALMRSTLALFEQYVKLNKKIPAELLPSLAAIDSPGRLADTIAAHLTLKLDGKQQVLEILDPKLRLEHVMKQVDSEIDILQIEKKIRGRVKTQMEKSQREYYLNEQMKAIQKELGDLDGDAPNEIEELGKKIEKAGMPKLVKTRAKNEHNKLKLMPAMSAEATVVRNYLDWLTQMPWRKRTKANIELASAQKILDRDHYGLEKIKERIVEHLAVQSRVKKLKGPILCLVGPPGVGKTSLGRSIAEAVNRKFVRMSLGGVRDEAEIRGHRRTYIGSLPGKIIQNMGKVGVKNPLFLLDEIDKMSMDFRGDPSSALLEVLDPEQNHAFQDHYLEVDFDLSDVMFVCTANTTNIPAPLLDRMELIRLPGYTEDEKLGIARQYLLPKQLKANGVKDGELELSENAIRGVIRYYTREAGVRNLERHISKLCRKVVKEVLLLESQQKGDKPSEKKIRITEKNLAKYLGVQQYRFGRAEEKNQVGQVTGLAWTEAGGDLLTIEAALVSGKGKLTQTGSLGDVMQESIHAALTVVRSRAAGLGVDKEFHQKHDIHVHVPEGATPKDGPSAGIAMCTALVSALTGIPVKSEVAMTGEITLRGEVLPIGGLKEKLLAAHRGGIKTVVIPHENVKDLTDIPDNIKGKLEILPVRWIEEVLKHALERQPEPKPDAASTPPVPTAGEPDAPRAH